MHQRHAKRKRHRQLVRLVPHQDEGDQPDESQLQAGEDFRYSSGRRRIALQESRV